MYCACSVWIHKYKSYTQLYISTITPIVVYAVRRSFLSFSLFLSLSLPIFTVCIRARYTYRIYVNVRWCAIEITGLVYLHWYIYVFYISTATHHFYYRLLACSLVRSLPGIVVCVCIKSFFVATLSACAFLITPFILEMMDRLSCSALFGSILSVHSLNTDYK